MSRARIFADLASGALDMSLSGIPTPERDRYVWFAIYGRVRVYALIRAAVAARVHGADDFLHQDQLRFGVVRTFLQPADQAQWLDQLRRAQRLHEAVNVDDLFQMLKRGRIDGLFAVPPFFRKFITDLHMQDEIIVQDWSPNDKGVRGGLMLAKSRFSEAEAERWRALIREMRDDGTLGRILGHYLPGTETKDMLDY